MPINSFLYPGAKFIPGYEVANSLRFDGSNDYMHKTPGGAGNRRTLTISAWVKRSDPGNHRCIMAAGSGGARDMLLFESSDKLQFSRYDGSYVYQLNTNALYRDPSAWLHIVGQIDTTQSTESDRVKLYVNGVQITDLAVANYPSQNFDTDWNSTQQIRVGVDTDDNAKYYGYMTEVVMVDGSALTPTSFGEFDEDSPTIWKPKNVSALTFGTNGFYLDFEDSSNLGNDASGGTDFTEVSLAATDQSTDTCTNNFATMNPIAPANISSASDGNLKILQSSSGGSVISTFGFSSGKWYWEVKLDSQVNYTQLAGVIKESKMESALLTSFNVGANDGGWGYFLQGNTDNGKAFHNNSASSVYTTMSAGNILSIAVDSDNGKIYFAVNGTYVNSGDPANGTGAVYTNLPTGENLFPAITNYVGDGSTATLLMNFGSPSFSISSGNSDANGYGNFEYSVPSGFYALNSKNLAEFG